MTGKTKVHITSALSSQKIIKLIDDFPNLEKITCSKSLYDRIPKKYLDALSELSIDVEIEYNQGKAKYEKEESDILALVVKGQSPKDISKILEIPLKRVYYLINKNNVKLDNYNRKYDENMRLLVNSMKGEGESVKDISSKLNIPIRTVYYIINGY